MSVLGDVFNLRPRPNLMAAVAIGLAAFLLAVFLPGGSAQAAKPALMSCGSPPQWVFDSKIPGSIRYRRKPRNCTYTQDGSMARMVILRRLRWRSWGGYTARARGFIQDNHDQNGNGFQLHRTAVTLRKPKASRGARGRARRYYRLITVSTPDWGTGTLRLYYPGRGIVGH